MARELTPAQEEKLAGLVELVRDRLIEEWPADGSDVTRIEAAVTRIQRECLHEITREWIQEHTGRRAGNRVACPCGKGIAIYRDQQSIDLVTAFGRVRTERAYFHCCTCRDGHCPQDRAWRIGPGNTTPTVQSIVSYYAAQEAYTAVPATLARMHPQIHLGVKTTKLIAQGLGRAVAEEYQPSLAAGERVPAVLADGTIVPMRGGGKEARVGVIYEPGCRPGCPLGGTRGVGGGPGPGSGAGAA